MNEDKHSQENSEQDMINLDIKSLWLVLKAQKWLIAAFVVVGLFIVLAAGFLSKPVFTKRIVISLPVSETFALNISEIRPIIQDINSMIEMDETDILVQEHNFSEEDIDGIMEILLGDVDQENGVYVLIIRSRREENIPNIARDTIQYMISNEFFSSRVEKQKSSLTNQIGLFQKAVDNAESLKATFIELIKKDNTLDLSFNVADIDKTIRDMKVELENIQKELALFKEIEIISRLDSPPELETYALVRNLVVGLSMSLFLGVIAALVLGWKRLIL